MKRIQFFYIAADLKKAQISSTYDPQNDFSGQLTDADRQAVEQNWNEAKKKGWYRGTLGTLTDTQGGLKYIKTDYAVWRAVASPELPHEQATLSNAAYTDLRISSVGVAVETGDSKIIVQKRQDNVPAGGKLDSSANGFCKVEDGRLDFEKAAYEKLQRELGLAKEEVTLEPRGVHSVTGKNSQCNSGMLAYKAKTKIPFEEIRRRSNSLYIADLIPVEINDLENFIAMHYANGSLVGDGAATMLANLNAEAFERAVERIRRNKGYSAIEFGQLQNRRFIPSSIDDMLRE